MQESGEKNVFYINRDFGQASANTLCECGLINLKL